MDTSSSSKVTVEYHDPAGIFPLVSREIAARLPLRNLGWQSPSRPLRQIKSLHLEFVPDTWTQTSLRPAPQQPEWRGSNSLHIMRGGWGKGPVKERRHQIPGLQTSPYLKIYVLRCDDKEVYKAIERKQVREWIRENAAASKKGKGEAHRAFEWMILHVVVPDTVAASEPRWRETSLRDSDELKERPKQGSPWPGKSTRTVFDKLRADFNESGKGGQERVAQIRLLKDQMPADLLPTPAVATTLEETSDERERAWHDVMYKFKTLILRPFDLRVKQLEADVAEQESRRSLPGFNFCTFFIHKEGLGKALESIGLVEDALVIYDELSLGLETVLRDLASGEAQGSATTFASYTDDIQKRILRGTKSRPNSTSTDSTISTEDGINEGHDKHYRDSIVRSEVSVFDFSCYVFSRQKALLLRLANAKVSRDELSPDSHENSEDLVLISEVCWRAAAFITSNARTLRQDALTNRKSSEQDRPSFSNVECLVSSWVYTVAGQILEETSSSVLDRTLKNNQRDSLTNGVIPGPKRSEFSGLGANPYPERTASLLPRQSRINELQNSSSHLSASEDYLMSPRSSSGTDGTRPSSANNVPGLPELVTYRAELAMMQRKALELLAGQLGWYAGWSSMQSGGVRDMEEVDLDDFAATDAEATKDSSSKPFHMLTPALTSTLSSESSFQSAFASLTNQAMRYYVAGTNTKRAQALLGDLAILKYQQSECEIASKYLQHVLPLYETEGWSLMESQALEVLRKCLKRVGTESNEEYVKVLLKMAGKACTEARTRDELRERAGPATSEGAGDDVDSQEVLSEAIKSSADLEVTVDAEASSLFGSIRVSDQMVSLKETDGFALNLRLQHLLGEELRLDQVTVRLVHMNDSHQEIWLASRKDIVLHRGSNDILLESSTVAFGPFLQDKVIFTAQQLRLVHEFQPQVAPEPTALGITDIEPTNSTTAGAHKRPWVFIYPDREALDAGMTVARDIHIDKTRHLQVQIRSGRNDVQKIELKLKPASAGLRLHLADAKFENIAPPQAAQFTPGQVVLGGLGAHSSAAVSIPYALDQSGRECFVRFQADYRTAGGNFFTFLTSARLCTALPLDVDVNDIFHSNTLFSTFTVRTTSQAPLVLTQTTLRESATYGVESPPVMPMPMTVVERQPVDLVYKVTRNNSSGTKASSGKTALSLEIEYCSLDELVAETLRVSFTTALQTSEFASLSRLLTPLLSRRAAQLLTSGDMEMSAQLGNINVPSFSDVGWAGVLHALPPGKHHELTQWLEKWHRETHRIPINLDSPASDLCHRITISVEVPTVDAVHTASLFLPDHHATPGKRRPTLRKGQPIAATAKISHTRRWKSINPDSVVGDEALKFVYELYADTDVWRIDGKKRAQFTACEGEEEEIGLTLTPLRAGLFALPVVDVQAVQSQHRGARQVKSETCFENAGEVVEVVEGQEEATKQMGDVDGEDGGETESSSD